MDKIPASANLDPALLRAFVDQAHAANVEQANVDQAHAHESDDLPELQAIEQALQVAGFAETAPQLDPGELILTAEAWSSGGVRNFGANTSYSTSNNNLSQLLDSHAASVSNALLNAL